MTYRLNPQSRLLKGTAWQPYEAPATALRAPHTMYVSPAITGAFAGIHRIDTWFGAHLLRALTIYLILSLATLDPAQRRPSQSCRRG
ncbi:hypothetical protein ACH4FX_38055 [Streptomyces sp. NPDC018019]|uniref:hypothetical protein n=1 Tax=Streptomyces sp. NPDC018019 TaxID=3365030 RepID=UPI0037A94E25